MQFLDKQKELFTNPQNLKVPGQTQMIINNFNNINNSFVIGDVIKTLNINANIVFQPSSPK